MADPFFEINTLSKSFGGVKAVNNVSFVVERDEIVGLIGPNGSGKTTLINCSTGVIKPTSGKVSFKGKNITRSSAWAINKLGISRTFQIVRPFYHLPTIANVVLSCISPRSRRSGEWVKDAEQKARDALEFVGIADLARTPASALSHGDLKRLEIARAIATEPELLFLDEPFGGLSPAETELLAKSIKRLHQGGRFGRLHSEGPAMVIVEHKLAELMAIVDKVIVINFGEIVTIGTPQEIAVNKQVIAAYTGKEVLIAT